MVDEVLVANADALLVGGDAALRQVTDDAVEEVVNVRHRLPGPEGHVHLAVVLKQLGLALGALEAQRVEERALVRRDGHLLLVDADLQLGEARLPLHGPQLGDLHDALQIVWEEELQFRAEVRYFTCNCDCSLCAFFYPYKMHLHFNRTRRHLSQSLMPGKIKHVVAILHSAEGAT